MIASELAGFASELTIEDVPRAVRDRAVLHLADCLGIAVASTTMDFGESVHRAGTRLGSGQDSRVIGWGTPLPAASAALVNGTLIHGLDFDDTHIEAIHHASAPALASALLPQCAPPAASVMCHPRRWFEPWVWPAAKLPESSSCITRG